MRYIDEVKIFTITLVSWILLLFVMTLFFFLFGIGSVEIAGTDVVIPVFSKDSFSVEIFRHIVTVIVPSKIPIIVTGPFTAFFTQVKISFFLSFIFSTPFLFYKLVTYLKPALYKRELKYIYRVAFPSSILFIGGCIFAYLYILPTTFEVLYSYTDPIGALSFLSVQELMGLVSSLVLATGISFMLPVFMVLLSLMHFVSKNFWVDKWRYAVVIFLILSAIITPDGSGISMIILSIPIVLLYGLGLLVSLRVHKNYVIEHNVKN